jgi:hypothetical protein
VPTLVLGIVTVSFLASGCANFSTTVQPVDVKDLGSKTIALHAGIREATIYNVSSGAWLMASQPAVKKSLKNTNQLQSDFTKAFIDYCRVAKLFETCVGEPFDASQVDVEISPKLRQINNRATYGDWLAVNFFTLDIPALFGWPYKNITDGEVEIGVQSTDGRFTRSYVGKGSGQQNTNFYALMFGLREVPHAMLSVNRSITAAFDEAANKMINDPELQGRSGSSP